MIVSDTDFLSSFAKIGELNLIFRVFKTKEITITKAVYDEIKESPVFEKLSPYFPAKGNKIKVEESAVKDVPVNFAEMFV